MDLRSAGGTFELGSYREKRSVLLYFQGRVSCRRCWAQTSAIQKNAARFHAAGIGLIISISTSPVGDIAEATSDERVSLPVLADTDSKVSRRYLARDGGQTFILVGKGGRIVWRADYRQRASAASIIPVGVLLDQLKAGSES